MQLPDFSSDLRPFAQSSQFPGKMPKITSICVTRHVVKVSKDVLASPVCLESPICFKLNVKHWLMTRKVFLQSITLLQWSWPLTLWIHQFHQFNYCMKYCYFIISVQILQLTKSVLFPTPHEWDGCPDTDNLKIFSISTGIRPVEIENIYKLNL